MVSERSGRNTPVLVTATSRPKRVAFLVDPNAPDCPDDLDAVVQHSILRWGGGHHPIVPTDGRAPQRLHGLGLRTRGDPDSDIPSVATWWMAT